MKKFSQFINEGAENCQKSTYSDNIQKIEESQEVNESVLLGAALIFGFCALADPEIRQGAAKAGKGLLAAIGGGAVGIWAHFKAKRDEQKAKKEEEKKEYEQLENEKMNRLFLQCKKTLKETPEDQRDSEEFRDAQAYMDAYTKAKFDSDGNEIKDPVEVNKRIKHYVPSKVFDRVIERANKAATDNSVGEMMQGVAKKAAEMTPEEVEAGETELRDDSINGKIEDAKKKAAELEAERDKKLKEAQEKGDDALVQSIKDEYEPKIKQANDNINKLNETKQNIQREKQAKIEKELLKQQEDELKAAQKEKEDLEAQKAEKLAATDDDAEKEEIEKDYEKKISDVDSKISEYQKKVDSTKESVAKLSTPVKPIEEPKKTEKEPQAVKDAEKKVEDLENEKKEALLKETDEEKKKQIEKEYNEKIKAANTELETAKTKALEKTGEEEPKEEEPKEDEDDAKDDDERIDNDDDLEKPEFSTSGGKVTYDEKGKDPRKFWKKRTYKRGDKTFKTKSYYNKHGVSISAEEFNNKVKNFEKKQKKTKNESFNQYYDKMMKMLFE